MRQDIVRLFGVVLSVLMPVTAGLMLYDEASRHQVAAFWDQAPGAVFLYGRRPDSKFEEAYRLAAASARANRFRYSDPRIVQTNDLFNLWYIRWRTSSVIAVTGDGKTLIIDGPWMTQFADEDLECIFAHEIAHVIDFQRQSEDHPAIHRVACQDSQQRADSIGRILCGAQRYDRVLRRYIKKRPIVRSVCADTTPVP